LSVCKKEIRNLQDERLKMNHFVLFLLVAAIFEFTASNVVRKLKQLDEDLEQLARMVEGRGGTENSFEQYMADMDQPMDWMDWRDQGCVTGVKNQGHCDSGWAFSAVGAIEGQVCIQARQLRDLSEQQLVSCASKNSGCSGGDVGAAFQYLVDQGNHGIETQSAYPYTASDVTCNFAFTGDDKNIGASVSGYKTLNAADDAETALQDAVKNIGPVSAVIDAQQSFVLYTGGIYDDTACAGSSNLNHAVLVVGYGPNYWIVKNSWGSSWGENGYIRIVRGKNMCGIATQVRYPLLG